MNEWLQYLILGAVQGVAEFLPISSDGHLLLAQNYMSLKEQGLFVTVMLHLGTFLATAFFFKDRIKQTLFSSERNPLLMSLFLAMIPTGVVALVLKKIEENGFFTPTLAAALLTLNGGILFAAHYLQQRMEKNAKDQTLMDGETPAKLPGPPQSLLIGFLQGLAALPGVSRSGSTIMGGLFGGLSAKDAFEYSFLLSLPAVGAAIVFEAKDISGFEGAAGPLAFGVAISAVVGYFSLGLLRRVVTGGKLHWFGVYCVVMGLGNLAYLLMSGGRSGG